MPLVSSASAVAAHNKARPGQSPVHDTAPHLLVVDDDQRIRELLTRYLVDNGFRVTAAESAEQARQVMRGLAFDLLVLDVMMPGISGFDLARELRGQSDIPILMLTAKSDPEDRIHGLEIGVNDYLAKPFDPRELVLRINNIIKLSGAVTEQADVIEIGPFVFDMTSGILTRDGAAVHLTEREQCFLKRFTRRPGQIIARAELAAETGGGTDRAVDVQINRLRAKIEDNPARPVYLRTVRGKGYVLHVRPVTA